MNVWWLTFTDGSQESCEGQSAYDAQRIAEKLTGKTVKGGTPYLAGEVKPLPYPSRGVIWQLDHPVGGKCPPFCYTPRECAGHTSCPKNRACDD